MMTELIDLTHLTLESEYCTSKKEFLTWLIDARPGDRCIYYVGFLGTTLNLIGRCALHEAGYDYHRRPHESSGNTALWYKVREPAVDLVQKRLNKGVYAYIAQKRTLGKPLRHVGQLM